MVLEYSRDASRRELYGRGMTFSCLCFATVAPRPRARR
ncbi:hypothetical protein FM106_29625 [Brachybacterium faecium]|nr:hypothetical protein FM106_29625 [Brachybacterium faecium]